MYLSKEESKRPVSGCGDVSTAPNRTFPWTRWELSKRGRLSGGRLSGSEERKSSM